MQEHTLASIRRAIANVRGSSRIEHAEALLALAEELLSLANTAKEISRLISLEHTP